MKNSVKITILAVVVFFIIACGVIIGSANVNILDILSIISNKIFGSSFDGDLGTMAIIWDIRLPRVLLAFLIGGAVAVSGNVCQSVLRNPLASPYTLGVSAGASLGAAVIIISGISIPILGGFSLPIFGFISGLITVVLAIYFAYSMDKTMSNNTIILTGMIISLFVNAILTLLISFAGDSLQNLIKWQMGSFAMRGWKYILMFLPFLIVGLIGVLFYTKELDVLTFGEEQAKAIGVNTNKAKRNLFLCVAILSGSAVAIAGTIGFIDLIAPFIARKYVGSKHKITIPITFLIGGCLMVVTDLVARSIIPPTELPVGAVTALIGAPFFAYVYFKKSK